MSNHAQVRMPVQGTLPLDTDECPADYQATADKVAALLARVAKFVPRARPKGKVDVSDYPLQEPLCFGSDLVPDASHDSSAQASSELDSSELDSGFVPVEARAETVPTEAVPAQGVSTHQVDEQASEVGCSAGKDWPVEKEPFTDGLGTFCQAHAAVLYRSLELLLWSKDGSSSSRQEIVDWIFTEVVDFRDSKDGKQYKVPAAKFPFSFENCCLVEGIDVDYARDRIWVFLEAARAGHKQRKAALH